MDRYEFIQTLYQSSEGLVELRPLPNGNDRIFVEPNDRDRIDQFCKQFSGRDLYLGVGTRDGKGGRIENVVNIPAVWCDIDFKDYPKTVIADKLSRFPFKPSLIVSSGGGVHLYWLLKEPVASDFAQVVDVNCRILEQLGGDKNAVDAARILRLPDTLNHKYNPPRPCKVHRNEDYYYSLEDFLTTLPEASVPTSGDGLIVKDSSQWIAGAMQGVGQGDRNATGARIAGYWINKVDPGDVLTILHSWNQNNTPPLPGKDIEKIVSSVSRYKEPSAKRLPSVDDIYDSKRMIQEYRKHIENMKRNVFKTGIIEIDKQIRGVAGGEVLTIIARAGSFKTAMLQNMMKNYVLTTDCAVVFFSLEMPISSIAERYYEMIMSMEGKEVEDLYSREGEASIKESFEKMFMDNLPNFYAIPTKVGLSDIPKYINIIEEEFKVTVGMIGIDYMGLMHCQGSNEYEVISTLARGVKTTAKMINKPIVLLSQTSRKGGEGDTEITMDQGRGSGAIEEAADFVLGLWQVEVEAHSMTGLVATDKQFDLVCKILKNRKGPRGSCWMLDLDPAKLTIGSSSEKFKPKKTKKQSWE